MNPIETREGMTLEYLGVFPPWRGNYSSASSTNGDITTPYH